MYIKKIPKIVTQRIIGISTGAKVAFSRQKVAFCQYIINAHTLPSWQLYLSQKKILKCKQHIRYTIIIITVVKTYKYYNNHNNVAINLKKVAKTSKKCPLR